MSLSTLYRNPVPLDRTQHRGKRIRTLSDFSLASKANAMFLACGEFSEACKEYVIAFLPVSDAQGNPTQDVTPVAVLGLRQDENLYVEANGRWDARYLPAYMRRYPLSYARTAEEQNSVMVDADWEGFNDTEGELLIEENGEPAPYLQQMMHF
ncbi:MAG TPA: SapC family protein, partial [Burkholderiaceae bacterium]|nr:SapC family protein [Burkholderiaceae bacterium]